MRGAENMAIDEAIAQAVSAGDAPPTLRLYAWSPPCVSLGRNQAISSVSVDRCEALGYDIVRRPTGGRAILHTDELTYSLIAPDDHPLMQGMILEVYLRIAQGLLAGLRRIKLEAQTAPETNRAGSDASAACFEVPSAYEIVVAGRKLLGSAQNRRAGYVLQHGSLPLTGDITRLIDCLSTANEADREELRRSLSEHAVTVEQVLHRIVSYDEAADAIAAGMVEALDIELRPGNLTRAEVVRAEELEQGKYGRAEWTKRT